MFSGTLPLFPCRRGVLFPGVPLTCTVARVAEVQLIADAIAGDCLVGVFGVRQRRRIFACPTCDEVFIDELSLARHERQAHGLPQRVLKDPNPGSAPPLALPRTVCLAQLRRAHPLPHGGMIVRLLGRERARVGLELPLTKPYRVVGAELMLPTEPTPLWHAGEMARARLLIEGLRNSPRVSNDPHPPGLWLDLLCQALPLTWDEKMELLDEPVWQIRYQRVADHVRERSDWLDTLEQDWATWLLPPRSGPN